MYTGSILSVRSSEIRRIRRVCYVSELKVSNSMIHLVQRSDGNAFRIGFTGGRNAAILIINMRIILFGQYHTGFLSVGHPSNQLTLQLPLLRQRIVTFRSP